MDVHLTLQGKGGVGKTFVAAILAQVIAQQNRDRPLRVIDTDPVNATLSDYTAFQVDHLRLQDNGSTRINERHFDTLMERLLSEDADFVIDNGAASFVPLSNYLVENEVIPLLLAAGKQIYVHVLITGGQGMIDTLSGLSQLADQLPEEVHLVVWLNEFFGPIESDGKLFEDMAVYKKNKARIFALVTLPKQSEDTFGADVQSMLTRKLSFSQATQSADFSLMSRQRLKLVERTIFDQVNEAIAQ